MFTPVQNIDVCGWVAAGGARDAVPCGTMIRVDRIPAPSVPPDGVSPDGGYRAHRPARPPEMPDRRAVNACTIRKGGPVDGPSTACRTVGENITGLPSGVIAQRFTLRPLQVTMDLFRFCAIATIPLAAWWDALTLADLIVVAFLVGMASNIFNVANQFFLPSIVSKEDLIARNGFMSGSHAVTQPAGPSLGGLLVQFAAAAYAMVMDAFTYLVSAVPLSGIRGVDTSNTRLRKPLVRDGRWLAICFQSSGHPSRGALRNRHQLPQRRRPRGPDARVQLRVLRRDRFGDHQNPSPDGFAAGAVVPGRGTGRVRFLERHSDRLVDRRSPGAGVVAEGRARRGVRRGVHRDGDHLAQPRWSSPRADRLRVAATDRLPSVLRPIPAAPRYQSDAGAPATIPARRNGGLV